MQLAKNNAVTNSDQSNSERIEVVIGHNVRQLRHDLDLTVTALAAATGLSAGMLSKIESGTTSPSLSTLGAIADALNVSIRDLLKTDDENPACSLVKAGTGMRASRRGTKVGHHYSLLIDRMLVPDSSLEPYLIRLDEKSIAYTTFRHNGDEMIYLLSGRMKYRHGARSYLLEPGDTLVFDANVRHGPEEILKVPTSYLSFVVSKHET
jgi:transcriptional regulator with XRE-family HTH domain